MKIGQQIYASDVGKLYNHYPELMADLMEAKVMLHIKLPRYEYVMDNILRKLYSNEYNL